jgi:trigger factor
MNITVEDIAACRKRVKIEVPADRVHHATKQVAEEYRRMAKIPGFRPGKAPLHVIEKMYKKEIESEVQRKLVPDTFQEAVRSRNLRVVSQPEMEDLSYQPGLSLSFAAVVELAPDFALPVYKGLTIPQPDQTVSDSEVEEMIERFRGEHADFTDPDPPRPLEMGDFAVIRYCGHCEGKPVAEWSPDHTQLGQQDRFWLWIKEDAFLPDFARQIVGMKIGDHRDAEITFPEADFMVPALAGKKATYHVELLELRQRMLPPFDDALAQRSGAASADAFRAEIRKRLESGKAGLIARQRREAVAQHLLSSVNFDLPEKLVNNETQETIYGIVAENQARGISEDLIEEKKQEIFANAARSAKDQVKLGFIVSRIAEKEQITVTQGEIARQVATLAAQRQVPIEKFAAQIGNHQGAIASIRESILVNKVLDFVLQQAKTE